MNLLENSRKEKKTSNPKRDQLKLNHMKNDINRNKAPSKTINLMYCNKNNTQSVVIMEKEKRSVSMIPKTRMNEIRLGEKGNTTTLNAISNKISVNQIKNVHSGYNKYFMQNGCMYGMKPGYVGRLDLGSTTRGWNIWNDYWSTNNYYEGYGGGDVGPNWTTFARPVHLRNSNKHLITHRDFMYPNGGNRGRQAYNAHINNMYLGQILSYLYRNPKIAYAYFTRNNPYNNQNNHYTLGPWDGRDGGLYCEFRRKTINWRNGRIISWSRNWYAWHAEANFDGANNIVNLSDGHNYLMDDFGF